MTDSLYHRQLEKIKLESMSTTDLVDMLRERDKRIGELEKENAKLKIDYEVLSCSVGDFGELRDKFEEEQRKNNELSDSLTKAKGIIQDMLKDIPNRMWYTDTTIKEAEQFLKEMKENV